MHRASLVLVGQCGVLNVWTRRGAATPTRRSASSWRFADRGPCAPQAGSGSPERSSRGGRPGSVVGSVRSKGDVASTAFAGAAAASTGRLRVRPGGRAS